MLINAQSLRSKAFCPCRAAMLVAMLILTWSVQAVGLAPIEDHYFGATLFVVPTGQVVWPPVDVNSLAEYDSVYGRISDPVVDHGYQAARLFFANGGQTLFCY